MKEQPNNRCHQFIDHQLGFVPNEQNVGAFVGSALRLAETIEAKEIQREILERRRTFAEVGREFFPKVHIKIAQMAVAHAARRVLTEEQLEQVRKRNRTKGVREGALTFMPEGYVLNGQDEPVETNTYWSPNEEDRLLELAADPNNCYSNGMHKGKPCFRMICDMLNREFHGGKCVRNMNSCARKWKRLLREQNGKESSADSPHNLAVHELPLPPVREA
ncbi:MAG: hypothetical protein PHU04_04815 [Candidatus Peribacteraceae bacterium]|nr:hypothetical protein [Candidatus Peribacteraceae bacterium]